VLTPSTSNKLYSSDIIRLILQLRKPNGGDIQTREDISNRSIIAIRNLSLSLYIDNRSITTDAKDCLQLINSIRHVARLSPGKCQVTFIRNNVEVSYDINRVIELFNQKKLTEIPVIDAGTPDIPIPEGTAFSTGDYYPVQNSLPATYGVGLSGLPFTASIERQAQAKQLKGYLFFYEQILANHFAQFANINAFFSASPAVTSTLSQQLVYNLPGVENLFVGFNPAVESFADFIADENNAYRQALTNALEDEDQFLDRRSRMLDHLLSRLGESMDDLAAMAFRESYDVPNASGLDLEKLQALQEERRIATTKRLLKEKSDFYYALPSLHESRLQSFGLPSSKNKALINIQPVSTGFGWQILNAAGVPVLQQSNIELTETAARLKAEEVLTLATSAVYYTAFIVSPGIFRLQVGSSESAVPSAQSVQTFTNATTGMAEVIQDVLDSWVNFSLSTLEAKLYHLLEIQTKNERRQLITPIAEYFEIFDDTISTKKFRLHQLPGASGEILLESETNYPDLVTVTNAINGAIQNGIFSESYTTDLPAPGPFAITLHDPTGAIIARSPLTFPDSDDAAAKAEQIRQHLYRYYSVEGILHDRACSAQPVSYY
jgi:hypothetical protein